MNFTDVNIKSAIREGKQTFIKVGDTILIRNDYGYRPIKYYYYIDKHTEENDSQSIESICNDICSEKKNIKAIKEYSYTHVWNKNQTKEGTMIEFCITRGLHQRD